jgi:hypothetical protein
MPVALVSAARGIGDILRVTPLIRVCRRLGYEVDLLLAPDYPETVSLLASHADVGRVFVMPSPWRRAALPRVDGISATIYDVATFTIWSQPYRRLVRARRSFVFDQQQWIREGDTASIRRVAADLGWSGALPPPCAVASSRRFDLPAGTVALHPGCKPDWPWKKWHGFEELARRLPSVVIVGSHEDQRNERTYFGRRLVWPPQARDFSGTLTLADTAAVIEQCSALVANDSGLMHLGVALGVPTFGIFGITSPHREAIDAANMHAVTKGLPCETACHSGAWGRRDCERHLECLRTLQGDAVLERLAVELPRATREHAWTS